MISCLVPLFMAVSCSTGAKCFCPRRHTLRGHHLLTNFPNLLKKSHISATLRLFFCGGTSDYLRQIIISKDMYSEAKALQMQCQCCKSTQLEYAFQAVSLKSASCSFFAAVLLPMGFSTRRFRQKLPPSSQPSRSRFKY